MYKIICDGITICDPRVEELALINPIIELEENRAGSFTFKMPKNHPYIDTIQKRVSIIEVYDDDVLLFAGSCTEIEKDFYNTKKIYCEGELAYLNDSIQRPARYQDITVRGYLEAVIANHNAQVDSFKRFQVGIVTVTDNNDSLYRYTNMESTMESLKQDLVDDLGGFIRIRHQDGIRYIDYLADYQNTNSQIIKFGKNLLDLTSNIDSSEIATAIIPLGALQEKGSEIEGLETRLTIKDVNEGLDYVCSTEAVNNYGWIYKVVTWDDVTTPAALKTKGEKYLADIQFENMVINAQAVDMHIVEGSVEMFKLGDKIRVLSDEHGLDRYFPLTKMSIYLNARDKNTITLGSSERVSFTAKTNQVNSDILKKVEDVPVASDLLKQAKENATQLIQAATNGYIVLNMDDNGNPKELLVMDTNDIQTATKVWRWNVNGLGYSSNGYNGTYGLAMTMDGHFVADAITVDGLVVGKNVTMGPNATISWEKVTGTDDVAMQDDIPDDDYITQISKNAITAAFIKALNLQVGNEIQMGPDAKIAWGNVTGTDDVANKDDIPTDYATDDDITWNTLITNNSVVTQEFEAQKLKITGGSVSIETSDAENDIINLKTKTASTTIRPLGIIIKYADDSNKVQIFPYLLGMSDGEGNTANLSPTLLSITGPTFANVDAEGLKMTGGDIKTAGNDISYSTNGWHQFHGYAYFNDGSSSASDERMKHDIKSLDDKYLSLAKKIEPKSFIYNHDERNTTQLGVVAQDILQAEKTLGINEKDNGIVVEHNGRYAVNYNGLNTLSFLWLKDLEERIKALEEKG